MKEIRFITIAALLLGMVLMWAIILGGQAPIWRPDFESLNNYLNLQRENSLMSQQTNQLNLGMAAKEVFLARSRFVSFFPRD